MEDDDGLSGWYQCDQMDKLFCQNWVIYNNKNVTNGIKLPKIQILPEFPQKLSQTIKFLPKRESFPQFWLRWSLVTYL